MHIFSMEEFLVKNVVKMICLLSKCADFSTKKRVLDSNKEAYLIGKVAQITIRINPLKEGKCPNH